MKLLQAFTFLADDSVPEVEKNRIRDSILTNNYVITVEDFEDFLDLFSEVTCLEKTLENSIVGRVQLMFELSKKRSLLEHMRSFINGQLSAAYFNYSSFDFANNRKLEVKNISRVMNSLCKFANVTLMKPGIEEYGFKVINYTGENHSVNISVALLAKKCILPSICDVYNCSALRLSDDLQQMYFNGFSFLLFGEASLVDNLGLPVDKRFGGVCPLAAYLNPNFYDIALHTVTTGLDSYFVNGRMPETTKVENLQAAIRRRSREFR